MPPTGRTAVYRLYDSTGCLLYVGMTANPDARFGQHSVTKDWWPQVIRREIEWHETRAVAAIAEAAAIRSEGPRWNVNLRAPEPRAEITTPISAEERAALFAKFKKARAIREATEPAMKEAALRGLQNGATTSQLARLTGLSPQYFSVLARSAGIDIRGRRKA